jgi:hypothetical protein
MAMCGQSRVSAAFSGESVCLPAISLGASNCAGSSGDVPRQDLMEHLGIRTKDLYVQYSTTTDRKAGIVCAASGVSLCSGLS